MSETSIDQMLQNFLISESQKDNKKVCVRYDSVLCVRKRRATLKLLHCDAFHNFDEPLRVSCFPER